MRQKNLFIKSAMAAAVALISSNTNAAGFQLNEFSAIGLGRAYSGEGAVADSAASASRNPATMMMFDRPSFSGGLVYIAPNVNISGKSPSGASLNADSIADDATIPNLHFIYPVNEQWALGTSLTTNYGLATGYSDQYAAGPYAGNTDLTTGNFNLSTAYRLNDHFSFGLGFDAIYAKAKIERYAGESGASLRLPADAQIAHLNGNAWGYGWNAGILYEVDQNNRFGLTYRSEVKIDFDGNYRSALSSKLNNLPPAYKPEGLPYGTDGNTMGGSLTLNLPEIWEVSGYHRIAPQWAIHYNLTYTSWNQFEELKATSGNNTLFYKDENFRDAYRVALGTTYYYDDNWTFRGGIAFDDSPVPASTRSISIPDQDRLWLSAGASYAFNKDASVDLGISYMHGKHVTVNEGPYNFRSDGTAWMYGVGFNYTY